MWLLLIPLAALIVIVVGVATLAALMAVLWHVWPLALIAVGIWLLVRNNAPYRRGHWRAPAAGPFVGAHQADSAPRASDPPPVPDLQAEPRLPVEVQARVDHMRRKAESLLGQADRFPPFSHDLYIVRQTLAEYLPRTLDAYLSLPTEHVDPSPGGSAKPAVQELTEQLDLMESKLDEIAQDLERPNLDRLLANRRFLEDRCSRASA